MTEQEILTSRPIKIMFTGEQGLLATTIAREARAEGFEVAVAANDLLSNPSRHHPWLELDVADAGSVREAIFRAQPDLVVHLAAMVNTDKCDNYPETCISSNLLGIVNVLESCKELGVKLVYFSTTATYDPAGSNPRPFTELSPQRPPTLYGITKYAGELLVTGQSAVPWMVIRPCFIYGDPPRDHSSQLCKMAVHTALKKLWPEKAGGTPRVLLDPFMLKDYMRVEDFARAVLKLLVTPHWGQIFNVSYETAKPVSWYFNILAEALHQELDMEWVPETDYMGDHLVSSEKLKVLTGWKPIVSQEAGLAGLANSALKYVADCREGKARLLYS